jgi:hypothetical protein
MRNKAFDFVEEFLQENCTVSGFLIFSLTVATYLNDFQLIFFEVGKVLAKSIIAIFNIEL